MGEDRDVQRQHEQLLNSALCNSTTEVEEHVEVDDTWSSYLPSTDGVLQTGGIVVCGVLGATVAGGPGLVIGAMAGATCYVAEGTNRANGAVAGAFTGGVLAGPVGVPIGMASVVAYNNRETLACTLVGGEEDEEEEEEDEDPVLHSNTLLSRSLRMPSCATGLLRCFEGCGLKWPHRDDGLHSQKAQESMLQQSNRRRLQDHAKQAEWRKSLLLYDVSHERSSPSEPIRASHIPLNGHGAEPLDNDHFTGNVVIMHRPAKERMRCAHKRYFSTRSRRWEVRIQGRFKKVPVGKLCVGVSLPDYDYSEELSRLSLWLQALGLGPLEAVCGSKLYFTFGDRAEAAKLPSAEVSHVTGQLTVFDQIIVTAEGEELPPLCGPLESKGITRHSYGGSPSYVSAVERLRAEIDTQKTYTFCFWSCSKYVDLVGDALVNLVPLMPSLKLSSTVLGNWPVHFVFYEIENLEDRDGVERYLEKHKSFFLDLMIVNPRMPENLDILQRYRFQDAAKKEDSTESSMWSLFSPPSSPYRH